MNGSYAVKIKSKWMVLVALACVVGLAGCAGKKTGEGNDVPGAPSDKDTDVSNNGGFGSDTGSSANPDARAGMDDEVLEGRSRELQDRLRPVFFAFDRYDLTAESRDTLTANAGVLREYSEFAVWIEGHCDERGTNEYNLALGDRRARAARDFLVAAGISADRLAIISYGEEKPFAHGHDEASWSQNRRAQFTVKGQRIGL